MATYSGRGSTEFEWPPRDDVLERDVFRRDDPLAPLPDPASASPPHSEHVREEPHVVLRRAIEAREAQAKTAAAPGSRSSPARTPSAERKPRPKAFRSRAGGLALTVLLLVLVLQTAYIVRTRPGTPLLSALASGQPAAPGAESPPAPVDPPASPPAANRAARPAEKQPVGTSGGSAAPRPAATRLVVRSDPPGARVLIDGRDRGRTPVAVSGLAPGEHRIVLERDGVEVRQTIRLGSGGTVSVLAPMPAGAAATGWIAVDSPIELDVIEDGALLGTSRSSRILLQSGEHTLQLVNPQLDFRDVRQVHVAAGSVLRLPVELPRSDILLNATPWAEVWIDGKHVGQTPIGRLSLPIGTYEVVFRHPDLGEKTTTAIVKAGAPTRVTADLRQRYP